MTIFAQNVNVKSHWVCLNLVLLQQFCKKTHLFDLVTTGGGVLFRTGVSISIENAKFMPILTNFSYFVANLCTFWCTFYRPKECGGVPKLTNMRYDKIFFPEPQSVGARILSTSAQFHASLWRGKAYSHSCRCSAMS